MERWRGWVGVGFGEIGRTSASLQPRGWRGKDFGEGGRKNTGRSGVEVEAGERKAGVQESRVIKVLSERERGSWRTAAEAALQPRGSEPFSAPPFCTAKTQVLLLGAGGWHEISKCADMTDCKEQHEG